MPAAVEPLYPDDAASPADLHRQAADDAVGWSYRVAMGGQVGFPWLRVNEMVGPLLEGWLVLIGGRGKGGKSTILRETFSSWVTDFEKRVCFVGTEQGAGLLRLLWACLRCQAPIEAALNPSHPRHSEILDDVQHGQAKLADRAIIVAESALSLAKFRQWARYAWREKCDVLMLDHFHRIEAGPGETWADRNNAVKDIKTIAEKSRMLVVAAAQMKNGEGGALGEYEVPGSHSWAETAGLRRECDVAIQVWRPFKIGVTREQKAVARDDSTKLADIVDAGVMAVRCDAHRYLADAPYKAARLYVHDGQVTSWPGGLPPRSRED